MRSRLEARAASILDAFGMIWEYEVACFADGPRQYLPDFLVAGAGTRAAWWVEVKPISADLRAAMDRMEVILASNKHAHLALWLPEHDFVALRSRGGGWYACEASACLAIAAGAAAPPDRTLPHRWCCADHAAAASAMYDTALGLPPRRWAKSVLPRNDGMAVAA